jgi:hypothetical protein
MEKHLRRARQIVNHLVEYGIVDGLAEMRAGYRVLLAGFDFILLYIRVLCQKVKGRCWLDSGGLAAYSSPNVRGASLR